MSTTDRRALRPQIETAPATTAEEACQNTTLRPVLKMQHELLVQAFEHYLQKRKTPWAKFDAQGRAAHILHSVRKDRMLRQLLLGIVVGQFTADELVAYFANESALQRRLGKLLEQRLVDALG
ncbi:MAG: hypothetical protein AAGJ82_11750 [Bacteroidota bacterium]